MAPEPATKQELDDLRGIVLRSIMDAKVRNLSADGKFSFSYNAARCLPTIVVRAAGYRIKSHGGGHYNTFLALEAADAGFATVASSSRSADRNETNFPTTKLTW